MDEGDYCLGDEQEKLSPKKPMVPKYRDREKIREIEYG